MKRVHKMSCYFVLFILWPNLVRAGFETPALNVADPSGLHKAPAWLEEATEHYCIAGSVGIPGVNMTGLPGRVVSDAAGHYQALVKRGEQYMVVPVKAGCTFTPAGKLYSGVNSDFIDEDYDYDHPLYTLSGSVGLPGVTMMGLPTRVVSDEYGRYETTVPHGWSGHIIPVKSGYDFNPPSVSYPHISQHALDQDYTAYRKTVTLSGAIVVNGRPVEGILIETTNQGGLDRTDAMGRYYVEVPYGWSGELRPVMPGVTFDPTSLSFYAVTEHTDSVRKETITRRSQPYKIHNAYADNAVPEKRSGTVVIPTSANNPLVMAQIQEDLRVMGEIMEERLGAFARQTQESLFIQDYGVVFSAKLQPAYTFWGSRSLHEASAFEEDQASLNLLQDSMLKLLRYAANIRHVEPNEWVVVSLSASNSGNDRQASSALADQTMTLRVQKRYVDSYAANRIDFNDFARQVQVTVQ